MHQPQQPPTGPPIMPEEPIGSDEENIYVPPDLNDGLLTVHSMSMEKLRLLVIVCRWKSYDCSSPVHPVISPAE